MVDLKAVRKIEINGKRHIILSLILIGIISLLLRLHYFPFNVPLVLDAFNYFTYATDTSILGHFPSGYHFPNNGWPAFLSFFFLIFHYNNFIDYMMLQRLVSISLSVLTIIPVYLLCRRFFDQRISLIGGALFGFEPHVIQNSLLGITEPLYIIGVTISLFLFLSNNRKMIYLSFAIAALSTTVRYEGAFLIFIFTIMFLVRFRKERMIVAKYAFALSIFILILLPVAYVRIQTTGNDGLTSQIVGGGSTALTASSSEGKLGLIQFVVTGFENLIKYFGWISLPFYIFFLPFGAYLIFKEKNSKNATIIISIIILSIPAFYAFARGIQDPRYLYVLYPSFSVLSILPLSKVIFKFKNTNFVLISIVIVILVSSCIFLEIKKYDYEHQAAAFKIAQYVTSVAIGINDYYPEDSYIIPAELPKNWPQLKSSINFPIHVIPTQGFDSIQKYIESAKNSGLTHLIIDGNINKPAFLNDVYFHEKKYPYLVKVYDSTDNNLKYHVKIYKIDYDMLEQLNKLG
jgi:4-amino-4-deoxy-L-arabinose transferase-like glycosyltransferase